MTLFKAGKTVTTISAEVERPRDAVRRVVLKGNVCGARRLIVRMARTGTYTARILQAKYATMISVRRVQQLLAAVPDLTWKKPLKKLTLSETNKIRRLQWARPHLNKVSHISVVLFLATS